MIERVTVKGEVLELLPEKMIWWAAKKTLLVADTHFGKAATFRKAGIPVPAGTTTAMLERLSRAIVKCAAKHLIVLGDFVHSSTRSEEDFEVELVRWRERHPQLGLTLVKGNHDRGHDRLFQQLNVQVESEPFVVKPFALCHFHLANQCHAEYALAGHIHPGIRLLDAGRIGTKIACFHFTERFAILPAFGEFTGLAIVDASDNDQVFAVTDDRVVDVTSLLKNSR